MGRESQQNLGDVTWLGCSRCGRSATRFGKIEQDVRERLALSIGKRHKRGRGFGWTVLAYQSLNYCGLLLLDGWHRDCTQGQ